MELYYVNLNLEGTNQLIYTSNLEIYIIVVVSMSLSCVDVFRDCI